LLTSAIEIRNRHHLNMLNDSETDYAVSQKVSPHTYFRRSSRVSLVYNVCFIRTTTESINCTTKDRRNTRNKSIVPSRTMHTGRMSGHSTKKDVNCYVITMRSRLFPANSASVCLRFAKSRPQFCESCGATYRRICEMFSALQSTSGPVTDVVKSVQIDA